jgi:hypothetical protein
MTKLVVKENQCEMLVSTFESTQHQNPEEEHHSATLLRASVYWLMCKEIISVNSESSNQ